MVTSITDLRYLNHFIQPGKSQVIQLGVLAGTDKDGARYVLYPFLHTQVMRCLPKKYFQTLSLTPTDAMRTKPAPLPWKVKEVLERYS